MNFDNHPCFNPGAHKKFGRVHLPVAPRCNVQCRFCNRKYDCVNESRPGVTSGVLTPAQSMLYLEEVFKIKPNISVVGIAGPGDPFANAEETMETFRLVRETYPDMMLCVATNGLNLQPYVDEIAKLKVSHVTVTINGVDPDISKEIYSYIRWGKRARRGAEGAEILLKNQLEAVKALKKAGVVVKINSIIIPGINDHHIVDVAKTVSELGADILNCVPYYPNEGAYFENIPEPSKEMVNRIRKEAEVYMPQMRHCKRCRADAVGLLGETPDQVLMKKLRHCEQAPANATSPDAEKTRITEDRPHIAVASREGVLVNEHLGEAGKLLIYTRKNGQISLLEARDTPPKGGGNNRWEKMADNILSDCSTLLVSGVGEAPKQVITAKGVDIFEIEGVIEEAVGAIYNGDSIRHLLSRDLKTCGAGCGGNGTGCG